LICRDQGILVKKCAESFPNGSGKFLVGLQNAYK